MAKLTSKARGKLPASKFALPGERKYPITDKSHAANAKARASQMKEKGKLSNAAYNKVLAKANRKLKGQ